MTDARPTLTARRQNFLHQIDTEERDRKRAYIRGMVRGTVRHFLRMLANYTALAIVAGFVASITRWAGWWS